MITAKPHLALALLGTFALVLGGAACDVSDSSSTSSAAPAADHQTDSNSWE